MKEVRETTAAAEAEEAGAAAASGAAKEKAGVCILVADVSVGRLVIGGTV